ncbi:MAG: FkbM family methyltransferase [Clostridia bacterium]|nr:FkbM family methyltransferase [Clostridia bacterium]
MNRFEEKNDLWEYLKKTNKTVVMYGMGNGADKILSVCDRHGIAVADFFASDGFVRGHSFHGKRVLSYSETKDKYGAENIIVLLSFASSLPEVMATIRRVAEECELYAPDVPVCEGRVFDLPFAKENAHSIRRAYELMEDEESRRIFENTVLYKLTGNIDFLASAESEEDTVMTTLLHAESIVSYADLGAYNGDTLRKLALYAPSLREAVAFEPSPKTFKKLSAYAENEMRFKINAVGAAAWSEDTTLDFSDEGNRNSGLFAKGKHTEVAARTLDGVLNGKGVDYIKYDVEGCEREALAGSEKTISAYYPRLLVSAYHKSEDIFALPLLIHEKFPEYKLYYRRYPYIPAWDLNLICVR